MRVSPTAYRRITLVLLILLAAIVMTGTGVRVTGAGLGCPEWPNCHTDALTPREATDWHAIIEFVNRLMAIPVGFAALAATIGAWLRRPRRNDLLWLSLAVLAGVGFQAMVGRFVITMELPPTVVMIHFLASMVLMAVAVTLWVRAGIPDDLADVPRVPLVGSTVITLNRVALVVAAFVLVAGTIVTGTGPHGGDEDARRFGFSLPDVARIHGISALVLIGLLCAIVWRLDREGGAPPEVMRRLSILIGICFAQAAIGYIQYLNELPELLVWIHIGGATAIATLVVWYHLGCFAPTSVVRTSVPIDSSSSAAGITPPDESD